MAEVFRHLWSRRSFRYMAIGGSLHAFVGYGVGYWIPAMFNRSHGIGTAEMGTVLFYLGFASILGTLSGGYLGDLLGSPRQALVPLAAGAGDADLGAIQLLRLCRRRPLRSVLGKLSIPYLLGAYYLGPTFSMTQGMVGLRMRALASSILLFNG